MIDDISEPIPFTCERCHQTFPRRRTNAAAAEEYRRRFADSFGELIPEDAAIVCEPCAHSMYAWWESLSPEEKIRLISTTIEAM